MNYYRLMAGSFSAINLASAQENYNFTAGNELVKNASLMRDYINETAWKQNSDLTFSRYNVPTYHVICPLKTYFKDFYCFGEPIMDPIISAMPFMGDDGKIGFEFTSKYSSVVDVKLLQSF